MSKQKLSTKEIIVEKAISMYNEYGVEYVGVRELAKELGMKGGNITYYFPTKDDLVMEIAHQLTSINTGLFSEKEHRGLYGLLSTHSKIYHNQYHFRAMFVSLPNLLKQNEPFRKHYRQSQVVRRDLIKQQVSVLVENGYLRKLSDAEFELTFQLLGLINRFWISEATVDNTIDNEEKAVRSYLQRLSAFFTLIATAKGKKDIERFMSSS